MLNIDVVVLIVSAIMRDFLVSWSISPRLPGLLSPHIANAGLYCTQQAPEREPGLPTRLGAYE
jgi:hypothetical protein